MRKDRYEEARLTDAAVRKLKPIADTRRFVKDTGSQGLYLVIMPSGHRSFRLRLRPRPGARPQAITLGPLYTGDELPGAPAIGGPQTLASARQLNAEQLRLRATGENPIAAHRARKRHLKVENVAREAAAFTTCLRQFFVEHRTAKHGTRPRRWYETAATLGLRYPHDSDPGKVTPEVIEGGLAERWADKDVREITEDMIWEVLEECQHAAPSRRRALFAALSVFFRWLHKKRRKITANPCANLDRPTGPAKRERKLDAAEMTWFWKACTAIDAAAGNPPFGVIFKALLLSGCRLREVAGLRRDELKTWRDDNAEDDEDVELPVEFPAWDIPGSRTKNHLPHLVPLSPTMQKLIADTIAAIPDNQALLFAGPGGTMPSGWSRAKTRLDKSMLEIGRQERGENFQIPAWRLHDLRRSFASRLGEMGVSTDTIELLLNHISGERSGVSGTYNQSQKLADRRKALQRWDQHVAGLLAPKADKVVSMAGRRRRRR